jgi:acyl-coenzyme A synthetase/AMP-(fatty) acid ligase
VTTFSFDISGLEIWLPLTVGASVVVASRADVLDGNRLIEAIDTNGVTVLQATPATWRLLLEAGWTGRLNIKAFCGGEALQPDLAIALADKVGELWNMYGPTETTIWSTVGRVLNPAGAISIGRPIANTRTFVLDSNGQLAPVGIAGELYIAGEGVARGYRNRPELNDEKFVKIALPNGQVERVYRTGDTVRHRNDGQLQFLGRRDYQVKVRGHRVELGEIEAALAMNPQVRESVVVFHGAAPGDQRLVGYVTPAAGSLFDVEAARAALRAVLPEYMVPSLVVALSTMPLTTNGKINRNALPNPKDPERRSDDEGETVMTPVQKRVATIWQGVLRIDRIGLHDNFFDVGGHSLLLAKLHAGLKNEFGVDVGLVELFQRTTVALQADRLSVAPRAEDLIKRAQARAIRQVHG